VPYYSRIPFSEPLHGDSNLNSYPAAEPPQEMKRETLLAFWQKWNADGGPKYPHEKVIQFVFRHYPQSTRQRTHVLDLGCGSGVHCAFLASEGFKVTGVDFSPKGITNTTEKLAELGMDANLQLAAIEDLRFPPESFDLVISTSVFDHSGPIKARASLEILQKVLKKGARGFFLFTGAGDFRLNSQEPRHGYSEGEVDDLFNGLFHQVHRDQYITTYEGGTSQQFDWLITIEN
jgi:SAM-dependent methyltransferase